MLSLFLNQLTEETFRVKTKTLRLLVSSVSCTYSLFHSTFLYELTVAIHKVVKASSDDILDFTKLRELNGKILRGAIFLIIFFYR